MAEVVLKGVRKVYPHADRDGKKKRKKKTGEEPERKTNLQITDEGVVAVQDFDLRIADREFVVLVGPSGCGKSTTLRMVAGLEEITEGDLFIDGERMNDVPSKNRDIAMVFQNYALYPHMTVYENMAFSLKLRKMSKEDIDRHIREAAKTLDITDLLDRKPKALSGGQRQRVAIGRAFVRDPKVFLMDEPLSNLDAKLRNQMRAEIIKLRQKIDTTFIYVTHDQIEAMTLGDRIVVMRDGYIQQIGTPQEVFNHPANLFVAGFIGVPQMNFFRDCRLTAGGSSAGGGSGSGTGSSAGGGDAAAAASPAGAYSVEILGRSFPLPEEACRTLAEKGVGDRTVTVGVRPANIHVGDESDAGGRIGGIDARIDVAEMMGSEMHLHTQAGGNEIIAVVQTSEIEHLDVSIGAGLSIGFRPRRIHLFDSETEENLLR